MSKPNIALVFPGLEWNQDWLQQDIGEYLSKDWIKQFYSKGIKNNRSLRYSDLLSQYVLNISLLDKALQLAKFDLGLKIRSKYVTMISPVFQNMRLHQMAVLCGNEILNISYTEANILCEQLNALYEHEQYYFHPVRPDLWLLESPEPLVFDSPCPYNLVDLVDGQVKAIGKDGARIQLLQSEMQMFLHNCDVNQRRKKKSQFQINGVWFWNDIPSQIKYPDSEVIVNSKNIDWLSSKGTTHVKEIPDTVYQLVKNNRSVVLFSDILYAPNCMLNLEEYATRFSWLGKYIVVPILKMQNDKIVSKVELISNGQSGGVIQLKQKTFFPSLFKKLTYKGLWID
ncbi:MAG: hypothetical protein GKC53_05620 [Neisseriaceae bacterium]|nr:MAG: hypothetical protein GKC53_05620 [Neisseriaceae bacterium]